ncbi:MAG: hypothetical protein IE885_04135 [Campylobacterales bacterium]|nr:hypothetical protein [Campylobacterales bacterium]
MRTLNQEALIKLLGMVVPYPGTRIAHFSDSGEMMCEVLADFCIQHDYDYQLNCTQNVFYEKMRSFYADNPHINTVFFSLKRPRYMTGGVEYEYLFVTAQIPKEERSAFIEKCYHIIKNAGNIIIFLPKNDYMTRYEWMDLLQEHYYVASNKIDDLFDEYDVLISKKMHGWGNK